MNKFNHVLAFDLTSYGAALSIINQFVDDGVVKVFEVSPCGQLGILILVAHDFVSLQIIKSEVLSSYGSQILEHSIFENVHSEVLLTYLSQNKPLLASTMVVFEGPFVSKALHMADQQAKAGNTLIDFRVIRTSPKNVILTVGTQAAESTTNIDYLNFKKTQIDKLQPSLRAFFEV